MDNEGVSRNGGDGDQAVARDRADELGRLYEALRGLVDPAEIGPWMGRPNPAFDGLAPAELVRRGQTDRLWRMVRLMESGGTS